MPPMFLNKYNMTVDPLTQSNDVWIQVAFLFS